MPRLALICHFMLQQLSLYYICCRQEMFVISP
uniref:Uncharacterized protein n=1 Tax=Arundo donax TaxID=35708 RepID=A0A0A9C0B9_ARUDO